MNYPLNFAGECLSRPLTADDTDFVLPLGQGNSTSGEGIYGASYFAAAGIYKNLGYPPQAYDGTDSDGDGLVDNVTEVTKYASAQQVSAIQANLAAHKHNTARSEMLYALLVEGSGPLGSVFSRDDFTDKEVQDTDNDGLPEFIDAWGQPLQFYRWPLLYPLGHSAWPGDRRHERTDPGSAQPYNYPWEEREQDPLDENQQLVAQGWWFGVPPSAGLPANDTSQLAVPINPSSAVNASWAAQAFEYYFHRLSEPYYITTPSQAWDRSGHYRRAFYSKFLIVSSGPDKLLGLFQYNDTALHGLSNPAAGLIFNENNAMPFVFDFTGSAHAPQGSSIAGPSSGDRHQSQQLRPAAEWQGRHRQSDSSDYRRWAMSMQVGGNKSRMGMCRRRGFTLIELLVVILIILLVSAVTLPTVIPAIAHRQVTEAARLLQGNLVGARDAAIHYNAPRGIRLLPDPAFFTAAQGGVPTLPRFNNGQIDTTKILAANRFVPIESAPDYAEGKLDIYVLLGPNWTWTCTGNLPYPPYPGPTGSVSPNVYPVDPTRARPAIGANDQLNVLMVVQSALDPVALTPNSPTSWFWNIRIGDKIQIGGSGSYYTVVGPLTVYPGNPLGGVYDGNPELFVNDGTPGSIPGLTRTYPSISTAVPVEYLFLVNGVDDDGDGFVDDGWDSVNNNHNFNASGQPLIDELDEWENEKWTGALSMNGWFAASSNLSYNIRRRPVPSSGVREVALPSNIVVDLTTASTKPRALETTGKPLHGVRRCTDQSHGRCRSDHDLFLSVVGGLGGGVSALLARGARGPLRSSAPELTCRTCSPCRQARLGTQTETTSFRRDSSQASDAW